MYWVWVFLVGGRGVVSFQRSVSLTYSWLMMGAYFHFCSGSLTGTKLHSATAGAQVGSEAFL